MVTLHERYKTLRHVCANNLYDMVIEGCSVEIIEDQLQFFMDEAIANIIVKQLMEGK